MKRLGLVTLVMMTSLAGCSSNSSDESNDPSAVGANKDEYSCNQSAGYLWCPRTKACERPWELAAAADFTNTQINFEGYCGSSVETDIGIEADPE